MPRPSVGPTPHSNAWYDRLSSLQDGYYYPWHSTIADGGGEQAYLDLVRRHLHPDLDVLDVGCGHGEVALEMAPLCRSLRAYDRVSRFIDLARRAARDQGVDNLQFRCANSRADANSGRVRVPAADASIDLVISRRGPTHWIEDTRRFCRPGATLIQLNPLAFLVEPAWNRQLPDALQLPPAIADPDAGMRASIERRLGLARLTMHSCWTYDVPEWLRTPRDLHTFLTFGYDDGELPSWRESEAQLAAVFEGHAGERGLEFRNRRFLWKAVVDG